MAPLLFALLGYFVESVPYRFDRQSEEKRVAAMVLLCELYVVRRDVYDFIAPFLSSDIYLVSSCARSLLV